MSLYSKKGWSETKVELRAMFERWGAKHWEIQCEAATYARAGLPREQRSVTVAYVTSKSEERRVTVDRWDTPAENLRAAYLGLDSIRLNESRGLDDVLRQHYAALPAPSRERDPFEVLGVRPDASLDVINAAFRALSNTRHPDKGGSEAAMRELNAAYEAAKGRVQG